MSKSYVFEELEIDEPDNRTKIEKIQVVVSNHWKKILIGGLSETLIVLFAVLLTYFLSKQPACETEVPTSSTLPTSSQLSISSTVPTPGAGNYSCISGFTYINNKCWRLMTDPLNRADADQACKKLSGSTLFSIRNYQENEAVLEFVKGKNVENLWTGLTCNGNEPVFCTWDVESGTAATYNNFANGFSNNIYGKCMFYMTTGSQTGQWESESCNEPMSYVCELPRTTYDGTCKFNYDNYCYLPYQDSYKLSSEAQSYCASLGFNLASIHSANENRFAMSLFNRYATIAIGGIAFSDDLILWYDGTPTTFINVVEFERGNCLFIGNDFSGHWIGYDCLNDKALLLCKRKILEE